MSTHTIAEVKKFPVGTVVPSVSGTVKAVFPRKTGESQYGPWSLQGIVLSDGSEEIVVTCWGCDDLGHLKGTTASVAALGENNKTHKKQGLELIAGKDKDGTPRPELKMDYKKGGFIGGDVPNPAYQSSAAPAQVTTAPAIAPVANKTNRIEGVTVGMAINCAVRMATSSGSTDMAAIEQFARDLIALSNKLQSGN
jgi:hypothetical protein